VSASMASMADDDAGGELRGGSAGGAAAGHGLSSLDGRDWGWPHSLGTWDESVLHG
jgi:hypothetical protein